MDDRPIDAGLPSLERLLDVAAVQKAAVEGGKLGATTHSLRRKTTAWVPGVGCTATFEIRTDARGGRPDDVLLVRATPTGWQFARAVDDPALPGLGPTLAGHHPEHSTGAMTIVSYKPGESCVVDLGQRRFAKVVPPERLGALRLAFDALGEVAARDPAAPGVPAVLSVDASLGILVMERVEGTPLHDLLSESPAAAKRSCEQLGSSLAAMHLHRNTPLDRRDVHDDDDEVRRCIAAATTVSPEIGNRLEALLDVATARALALPGGEIGPAHGVLRTDQAIVNDGRPVLVDLDGACAAPPERDLANLSAYLWWRSVRRPGDSGPLLAMADAAKLGWRHAPDAPRLDDEVARVWRALSLLKIAGRRYRNLTRAEWPLVPQLLDEAAACL